MLMSDLTLSATYELSYLSFQKPFEVGTLYYLKFKDEETHLRLSEDEEIHLKSELVSIRSELHAVWL